MKKKNFIILAAVVILVLASGGSIIYAFASGAFSDFIDKHLESEEEIVLEKSEDKATDIVLPEISPEPSATPINTPKPEEVIPDLLLEDSVKVSDVYAIEGSTAVFYAFDASTEFYQWEYYSKKTASWFSVDALEDEAIHITGEMDEFHRNISELRVPAKKEYDGMEFRCVTNTDSTSGKMHLIKEPYEIKIPEELKTSAGKLLYTDNIPIDITYANEEQETIKGLQGLYFSYEVRSSEAETKDLNEITKTVTTVTAEKRSFVPDLGENHITLRYRRNDKTVEDYDINIWGLDEEAPVISSYDLGNYNISKEDLKEPIEISIDITADDNYSDSLLYYCAEASDEIPAKELFLPDSSLTLSAQHNGSYTVYVMDEAENISKESFELIIVDTKLPEIISVSLAYPDMSSWFETNTITVEAEDGTALQYNFSHNGMDSGYSTQNSYAVTTNGIWTASVKDAAGNISSRDIEIKNIDSTAPTILNIDTSQKKYNKNFIIGYDEFGNPIYGSDTDSNRTEEIVTVPGPAGSPGPVGAPGKNGINGRDGKDGKNGKDGQDGEAGKNGKDGNNVFVRYSASANGANMTTSPTSDTKFIGTYTGKTAATNPSQYAWSQYIGKDGQDGNSVFIRYSAEPNGANMTATPDSKTKYMGTFSGKAASENPSDYTWSQYKDSSMSYSEEDNTLYIII